MWFPPAGHTEGGTSRLAQATINKSSRRAPPFGGLPSGEDSLLTLGPANSTVAGVGQKITRREAGHQREPGGVDHVCALRAHLRGIARLRALVGDCALRAVIAGSCGGRLLSTAQFGDFAVDNSLPGES